jgi:hypothetical protein
MFQHHVITDKAEPDRLVDAHLKHIYVLRIGALSQKREKADVELKKLYGLRRSLNGNNLNGICSDEMFNEQNKLIKEKFTNLANTFNSSLLKHKGVLVCSIFPKGLTWSYPGYSKTLMSPHYLCLQNLNRGQDRPGTPDRIRTCDLRLRSSYYSTIPCSLTEVYELVEVRHKLLIIGSVAVICSRQSHLEALSQRQ